MVPVFQAQLQCCVVSVKQIENALVHTHLLCALYSYDAVFISEMCKNFLQN
jgi:hypothetical protein